MKRLFALFAIATLLGTVGCDDEKENEDGIELSKSALTLSRGEYGLVWVSGGNEDYSVTVSNPEIAEAAVISDNLGPALNIKAKKEGETVITVKDKEGRSAECSLTVKYADFSLLQTTLTATANATHRVPLIGGSGKFSATASAPEIAEVSIGADNLDLIIETKQLGGTVITITDTESRKTAECTLYVKKLGLELTAIHHAVNAAKKEAIEKDLSDNSPYSIGSAMFMTDDLCIIEDAEGTEISRGSYSIDQASDNSLSSYGIRIEQQIQTMFKFKTTQNSRELNYNVFFVYSQGRVFYFCEDLTDHYKTQYPDAGITQVGRGLVYKYNWIN